MNKVIKMAAVALFAFASAFASAQIPKNTKSATNEFSGVREVKDVQILNVYANNSFSQKSRLNAYSGINVNAVLGSYQMPNTTAAPGVNERWKFVIYSDGRFAMKPDTPYADLCATVAKNDDQSGFRPVTLKRCNNFEFGQKFFLQKSIMISSIYPTAPSYVIRLIDDPSACLAAIATPGKNESSSPITAEECQQSTASQDRWTITNAIQSQPSQAKLLDSMATLFALENYSENNVPIYNKSIDATLVDESLSVEKAKYKKLPFYSPFSGDGISAFRNSTSTQQELHIERFATTGLDKSIEVGMSKLPILSWAVDVKGKLDFKSSVQHNTKLWEKVDPGETIFFVAGAINVKGTYNAKITTDLGDSWSSTTSIAQDIVDSVTTCYASSKESVCTDSD